MKNLVLLFFYSIVFSYSNKITAQSGNPCDNKKNDIAQIVSGNYNCDIEINKYGKDAAKSKGTVKVEKVGENKIKISTAGVKSFTLDIIKESSTSIGGSITENYQTRSVSFTLYNKSANISGGSGNGNYNEGDEFWWFSNGISSENNKPENLDATAFKEITIDIAAALKEKIAHIVTIKFEPKGNEYKFTGCHSKLAIDPQGINSRIEETIPKNAEGVYEAKVFAKGPDGVEVKKSGNGGKSTFFPDDWDESRILEEAEHAIKNNVCFANGVDDKDGYYGYSKDGKVKIEFYYREATGKMISFFPSLR